MAGRKAKRGYHFNPDEWENVQNQISSTISLIEEHVIPDIPERQAKMLRDYLRRMALACRQRVEDKLEVS